MDVVLSIQTSYVKLKTFYISHHVNDVVNTISCKVRRAVLRELRGNFS